MAAQSNIVLNDGQGTPVAHTFLVKGARTQPDKTLVATWKDQSPTASEGYLTLIEKHTDPNSNGMEKFLWTLDIPTLESPATGGTFVPPATRAYGTIGKIEVWLHKRASAAEIANVVAFMKNFAAHAYFANALNNRDPAW